MDSSERFLETSRFLVQRILVPILVIIGIGGNVITVMVLTRRRMRCSTNIYLTALAVADLVYLLLVFILSFEHYPNINDIRYHLYWRFYGINHWLADAASSTSIWLVVCFTIERYIAVCYPIRGRALCTENRAKRVIVIVSILCTFATMSTTFEYQLTTTEHCIKKNCTDSKLLPSGNETFIQHDNDNYTEANSNDTVPILNVVIDDNNDEMISDGASPNGECNLQNDTIANDTAKEVCCATAIKIRTELTHLGENKTYKTVFYWFTSITFVFLPLILMATFNCFLVNAVRKSQVTRRRMTKSKENNSQAQENRMTVILIAVVLLFLICQTPSACILIYTSIYTKLDATTEKLVRGLGNIFNLLVSINAACNFLLYCALSRKYRRTFKILFCHRCVSRQSLLTQSSQYTRNTSNGYRRNASEYSSRNCETRMLPDIPRAKTLIARTTDNRGNGKLL
ncbi:Proctolin receptor [Carabus blaptoides fortunei]